MPGAVSRGAFVRVLRDEMREEGGIFALPLCLVLLLLFTNMLNGHERSTARQSIRSAIRDDILENCNYDWLNETVGFKNMENVQVPVAVVDWLELGYFPHLIWNDVDANAVLTGRYLQYNRIVGGVRLLTQRVNESVDRCDFSVASTLDTPCMYQTTDDWTAEGFDDLAYPPDGEETTAWSAGPSFDPLMLRPHKIEWFMLSETPDAHRNHMRRMRAEHTIDRHTRQLMVSMILYNADLHLICLVEANFFFARTGRVWPLLRIKTIDPDPYAQPYLAVLDFLFMAVLVGNCVWDFVIIGQYWKKSGCRKLNALLPHGLIWYFLDLVGLFFGVALAWTFAAYWGAVVDIESELEGNFEGIALDQAALSHLIDGVEQAAHFTMRPYRYVLLIYPLMLVMRLSLGFSGNPRLNMVMQTFIEARTGLYHFVIVFASSMFVFAILGILLFGREVESFSTLSRSLQTSIRMLFGDVDWDELSVKGFFTAVLFYWAFHITLVLVTFNILIAIILDTHAGLRKESKERKKPQTLIQQGSSTWIRLGRERTGEIVSLKKVWVACFRKYGKDVLANEPLTEQSLCDLVPKMPKSQAAELFGHVESKLREMAPRVAVRPTAKRMKRLRMLWRSMEALGQQARPPRQQSSSIPVMIASISTALGGDPACLIRQTGDDGSTPTLLALPGDDWTGLLEACGGSAVQRTPLRLDTVAGALRLAEWLAARPPGERTPRAYTKECVQVALALADAMPVPVELPGQEAPSDNVPCQLFGAIQPQGKSVGQRWGDQFCCT